MGNLFDLDKRELKSRLIDGLRIGLLAFIICFGIAFCLSLILNIAAMDLVKAATIGAKGDDGGTSMGRTIKLTSTLINVSMFRTSNTVQLGVVFFAFIPLMAFLVAKVKDAKRGITGYILLSYLCSSVCFSLLIQSFSWFTKGQILGFDVRFVSIANLFSTMGFAFILQLLIGMNSGKNKVGFIKATSVMFRMTILAGTILGLIDLIKMMNSRSFGVAERLLGTLALLPNMAIYKSLMLMGNDLEQSESMQKAINKVSAIQISFSQMPVSMKMAAIILMILFILIAVLTIGKKNYWIHMPLFAITFSSITVFLAYCTAIRLGRIIGLGEVYLKISYLQAFLIPLFISLSIGTLVGAIRKMISIILE